GWGLLAGAVCFAALLAWIVRFGVLPFLLLVLLEAAFIGAFVAGLAAWGTRPWRPLVAAVWWVAVEVARSSWPFGGLPWGQLGLTQHDGGPLLPLARTLGVYGVSLACAAVAVCVEEAWQRLRRRERRGWRSLVVALRTPALALVVVLAVAVVAGGSPPPATGRRLDVAAVQGNARDLPPGGAARDDLARIERVVDQMVAATAPLADAEPPDLTVWPENALDADPRENPELAAKVDTALGYIDGSPFIVGGIFTGPRQETFFNAVARLDSDGDLVEVHHKRKLVPFGEYVPLRAWLSWYPAIEQIPRDGVTGDEPTVFAIDGARVAPVTCFESIFGDLVRDQVRNGAELLVVMTNNASFGRTAASAQHLAFSRVRAVESGRWVLHAGISGISAVVDPHGRSSQETELFERTIVRADLPLVAQPTPFVRLGDLVGRGSLALSGLGLLWLAASARRRRRMAPPQTAG
ncbi:MAG TPA: apolipoprotein N-acyltransferase, partial [Egibacteraceae bacterium]